MHDYVHQRLPLSFSETWLFNYMRNSDHERRNAHKSVLTHHFSTVKRFNEEKWNLSHCKQLKQPFWSLWPNEIEIELAILGCSCSAYHIVIC